jgi:trigger factor
VGKIDGVEFPGGSDDNASVTIGDGRFIAGFSEQLVGTSAGDARTITVTFPADYAVANLAGKEATFDVSVKEVASADAAVVDDELAKRFGLESLDALRKSVREQIQSQFTTASRQKLKRALLDRLDEMHKEVNLPPALVDQEFDSIWQQVVRELQSSGKTFESEGTTEDAAKAEYRQIAERRVRLGLVMSEVGERNNIQVTEEEIQRAMSAQMRQFPGQEKAVLDYYRRTPEALGGLRAPIFEQKVTDFILELAKVSDKPVSREELMRDEDDRTV